MHLVLDNYGTHKTALIRRWLAKRPRFHLHFTPTGASWLNLVERWFALLTEKRIRRGVHRSTRELEGAIKHYLQCTNDAPKSFVWIASARNNRAQDPPRLCRLRPCRMNVPPPRDAASRNGHDSWLDRQDNRGPVPRA